MIERIRFDSAYTFLYSKRTGTPAAEMGEQVLEEIKKERFQRLLGLQNKISKELNGDFLYKTVEVLVEGKSKTNENFYTGRTGENKILNFKGDKNLVGKLVRVKVDSVKTWSLEGTVLGVIK